jgi:hypothetical protein
MLHSAAQQQAGQRYTMRISFDTSTKLCTTSMAAAVVGAVVTEATLDRTQQPLDIWDLHVGAKLNLLGRHVTLQKVPDGPATNGLSPHRKCCVRVRVAGCSGALNPQPVRCSRCLRLAPPPRPRQASDQATLDWLDKQADSLQKAKSKLQAELEKYRQVTSTPSQFSHPQRCEVLDMQTHEHSPKGGRTNLASLRHRVELLVNALRQHQRAIPGVHSSASDLVAGSAGPDNWMIDQRVRQKEEEEVQEQASARSASSKAAEGPISLDRMLDVPLAASAAGMVKREPAGAASAACAGERRAGGGTGKGTKEDLPPRIEGGCLGRGWRRG